MSWAAGRMGSESITANGSGRTISIALRNGVAKLFNRWDALPEVGEQIGQSGSRTRPD
jgi:hypothetical protein